MAQWLGQFTGQSLSTRVEDMEDSLRHAVAAFHAANSDTERVCKSKSVQKLAARLLSARLKLLKSRQNFKGKSGNGIKSLEAREAKLESEGIIGILTEFKARDILHLANWKL